MTLKAPGERPVSYAICLYFTHSICYWDTHENFFGEEFTSCFFFSTAGTFHKGLDFPGKFSMEG